MYMLHHLISFTAHVRVKFVHINTKLQAQDRKRSLNSAASYVMCFSAFRVSLVPRPFEEEKKGPGYKASSFTTSCRIWRGEADSLPTLDKIIIRPLQFSSPLDFRLHVFPSAPAQYKKYTASIFWIA